VDPPSAEQARVSNFRIGEIDWGAIQKAFEKRTYTSLGSVKAALDNDFPT
jgi:hypothetical protein